ncbi:hypothetical protein DPMN_066013 [Dreissena polymorpha]|uniref:Uncharacterized protein n=1 Tax=Dreissena polymorpha TaxID=45954 RepID=A0A9D4BRQ2_DREPO|nr:hypothetical protein DPMN_066013 [Dreissena polymorpha]
MPRCEEYVRTPRDERHESFGMNPPCVCVFRFLSSAPGLSPIWPSPQKDVLVGYGG